MTRTASIVGHIVLLALSSELRASGGTVHHVPAEFDSIQEAINRALDGDEIVVAAGTYNTSFITNGKAVVVRSADGPDETTLVGDGLGGDGTGSVSVIRVINGEGPGTVIEGFTIEEDGPLTHVGIHACGSSPIIRDCVFFSIAGNQGGSAIIAEERAAPEIIGCTFTENISGAINFGGGAIVVLNAAAAIRDCVFDTNHSQSAYGGAIYLETGSISVTGTTFAGNFAEWGGAMYATDGTCVVADCTFLDNFLTDRSGGRGGAIYFDTGVVAHVHNCAFIGNAGAHGGALRSDSGPVEIANSLFSGNSAMNNGGAVTGAGATTTMVNCTVRGNSSINGIGGANVHTVHSSVFWENTSMGVIDAGLAFNTVTHTCGQGSLLPGIGNINADPMFLDADGLDGTPFNEDDDLRLNARSPCVDAGVPDDSVVPADIADLNGNGNVIEPIPIDLNGRPRFTDGPNGRGATVDMGAYEFDPDCNRNGTPDSREGLPDHNLDGIPDECQKEDTFEGAATWINPAGGLFRDSSNWEPDTPREHNGASFELDHAIYTVSFDDSDVVACIAVNGGEPTFNLGGHDLEVVATDVPGVTLGMTKGSTCSLTVTGGTMVCEDAVIGEAAGAMSFMTVTGPGLAWQTVGELSIGGSGFGSLTIEDGAEVFSQLGLIGLGTEGFGEVVIGDGSSWSILITLFVEKGSLQVESGGTLQAGLLGLAVLDDGVVTGGGVISGPQFANIGTIRPGDGIGAMTIDGSFTQFGQDPDFGPASGSLEIEIGGLEHDQLVINGTAALAGGLFVELEDDFEPALGESFVFVDAAATIGHFDVAFLPGLMDGRFMRVTYAGAGAAGDGIASIDIEQLSQFIDFGGPVGTPVPGEPSDAVADDFNGDGLDDLAITIPADTPGTDGSVLVLLSDGSGSGFMSSQQITVGVDPSAITAGLLDDDTSIDLAVANAADDDVTVIFNMDDGSGVFMDPLPENDIPIGDNPVDIAAGNLHDTLGDLPGLVDLVTADLDSDTLTVLFNDGAGGFPTAVPLMGGDGPGSVNPTDLDNDKDLDLAVVNINDDTGQVYENRGDGGFGGVEAIVLPVGATPVDLVAADLDLDKDGLVDLVTANFGDGTVSVILNNGELDFAPAVNLPIGDTPVSLTALDMEEDGDVDLAAVVDDGEGNAIVVALRNDINGGTQLAFAAPEDLLADPGALFVLNGDLDGDGDADLITVNGAGGGPAAGPVEPFVSILPNMAKGDPAIPGDVTGDGLVDVADLVEVILAWGPCPMPPDPCPADLDADGVVGVNDLVEVILNWT